MPARIPSAYPPPVKVGEFVHTPEAAEDERIDVGVVFVGAGPAGLAGAIRLGQLLEADPATAEKLGETPIAVLDKGKVAGAHLLSGAVVNPSALRDLLPGTDPATLPGCYGPVTKESVFMMRRSFELRIPTPPPFHNKGNLVFSLSRLGRHLTEQAEQLGVMVLPETDAQRLLVSGEAVRGVKTGDKGLDRDGQPTGSFEPGVEVHAQATVLSEGTQGHLAGAAIERFRLNGRFPQVWSLGVKEVWKVPRPLDRVIHTLGWPFRTTRKHREVGGSFIYPMGDDMLAIGLVLGLDYRDASLSVHDSLQLFKTHPMVRRLLEGGERVGWGAKTIPEGGFLAFPSSFSMPGAVLTGDSAGMVNVPKLKGIHYAMRSGMLAAEAIYEQLRDGRRPLGRGRAGRLRPPHPRQPHLERPAQGAQHAPGAWARASRWAAPSAASWISAGARCRRATGRSTATPTPRSKPTRESASTRRRTERSPSTSSRACSCRATAAATTSPTTSASRRTCPARWPRRGWRCARRRSTRSAATTAAPPCS